MTASPEWSGSGTGGRRYSAFVINVERSKPWHTLTGRQYFFVDHDWLTELGEQLPVYRPPLNMGRHFGSPKPGEDGRGEVTVRYLTPHSKWSIHSEYQDNAHMLALSRGGPDIRMSTVDAAKIGVADNDWVQAYNRNGVVAARAVVSHRMPERTVFVHHAKDRNVNVPRTELSGVHNFLTRQLLKPTPLVGGYAKFTYAFNTMGPRATSATRSPRSADARRRCSTDARDGTGDQITRWRGQLDPVTGDLVPALPAGSPDRLLYLIKHMASARQGDDEVPATAEAR